MNVLLWILQVVLGLLFVMHSYILGIRHEQVKLQPRMSYVGDLPGGLRIFIAISELLGGIGLILPPLIGILPELAAWAAVGIAVIMALAAVYHFQRQEYAGIIGNLVILALAAFVAYGRFVLAPF